MNISKVAEHTAYIITEYYQNNITPFLEAFHEDALWIGPAQKQILRTRKAILEAFAQENHELRFCLHDLTILPLTVGSRQVCEIMVFFRVDTIWPDGSSNQVHQRVQFTWCMENNAPRIRICYISNSIAYDDRDTIYPIHFQETFPTMILAGEQRSLRMSFHCADRTLVYLRPSNLLYAETHSHHTILHTLERNIEVTDALSDIEKRLPDHFLRCHQSYVVNLSYITRIRRFELELTDGTILPVPEKKYTTLKSALSNIQAS